MDLEAWDSLGRLYWDLELGMKTLSELQQAHNKPVKHIWNYICLRIKDKKRIIAKRKRQMIQSLDMNEKCWPPEQSSGHLEWKEHTDPDLLIALQQLQSNRAITAFAFINPFDCALYPSLQTVLMVQKLYITSMTNSLFIYLNIFT